MKQCRMRTVTVVVTYMLGAASLASLALAGCSKDPAGGTVDPGREAVILSIAEANYGVSGGGPKSAVSAQGGARAGAASGGGAPQTRAIVDGGGTTFFTDRDRLGLFLRGDGYEDVDNRIVQLDYPGEGPKKKWNITGEAIPLYDNEATVTAYFPYSDAFGLTMSAVPLSSGPYDVNTNDVVWQRDTVHAAHTQAMFLEMQHAMTRVKIRLKQGKLPAHEVGDVVDGGVVYWVNSDDASDFRVVALDQGSSLQWAASSGYVLGSGAQSQGDRNGAAIMTLAKNYSAETSNGTTGTFATDFPAFGYCYNKTPEGTWYLPSIQELKNLYDAKGSVESVITAHKGTAFSTSRYWSATEFSSYSSYAWYEGFGNGFTDNSSKTSRYYVRCVRSPLSSDVSDPGEYAGEGKIMGVQIADAEGVSADDRVVYLDGTLDLTQATPVVTPGWPDAVVDKSEKTLTAEGVLYDLLLLPVDKLNEGKVMLNVVIDDKLISAPFPVDVIDKWEAGKAYTYEVEVRNGEAQVVFGKATVTPWNYGGSISGSLDPSNPEYGGGDVQDWGDNEWEIGPPPAVGSLYGGGVVYWVNGSDFRVVALDESIKTWAANTGYVLGSGAQSESDRNGAAIMTLAKQYSDNKTGGASGDFATDFPAFAYCYNYQGPNNTDPVGTWYLPSKQELMDLYSAKGSVESVITAHKGTAFSASRYWSASEAGAGSSTAWYVHFSSGSTGSNYRKPTSYYVRCVRGK